MHRRTVSVHVDADGRIIHLSGLSPAAAQSGVKIEDWIGTRMWDNAVRDDQDKMRAAFAECLLMGKPQTLIVSSRIAQIEERWLVEMERIEAHAVVRSTGTLLAPNPEEDLSAREQQIVWLSAHDYDVDKIARTMGIESSTVGSHLRNIRHKLHVSTSAAIGAYAVVSGIYSRPMPHDDGGPGDEGDASGEKSIPT